MVQAIPESVPPQPFTHHHLRLSILPLNGSHVIMSLLWSETVHDLEKRMVNKISRDSRRRHSRNNSSVFRCSRGNAPGQQEPLSETSWTLSDASLQA